MIISRLSFFPSLGVLQHHNGWKLRHIPSINSIGLQYFPIHK